MVADKNMQFTLKGALSRPKALGIRNITFDVPPPHVNRDGGVRTTGADMLRLKRGQYSHAIMLLDFEGSGASTSDPLELEKTLDQRLAMDWGNSAKAIVIMPEVDAWIWGSDNVLHTIVGRISEQESLRQWLRNQKFLFNDQNKPIRPKEAFKQVLEKLRKVRSSSWYEDIAKAISMQSCTDPAFIRLRQQLQEWFPVEAN